MKTARPLGRCAAMGCAILVAALLFAQSSVACLAHYCSPDSLVVECPLILIGRVEKVEKGTVANSPAGRHGFSLGQDRDEPKPTKAQVRVLRVLRGKYSAPTVTVGSGPIESCAPYDVHYSFKVGEELIFLLPAVPGKEGVALRFGGSLLPVSKTEMIESRLARARQYQAAYLAGVERDLPQIFAAARKIADQSRHTRAKWPELTRVPMKDAPDLFTEEESEAFKKAREKLVKELSGVDVEAIRVANAIEWLSDDLPRWSDHPLWKKAVEDIEQSRRKEIAYSERAAIRRELVAAGVGKEQIDHYLADIADNDEHYSLDFPTYGPYPYRERNAENLTTDFILRFHRYDRGCMFRDYGMDFDQLAKLDPARLSTIIPALYDSDDRQLKIVACRAIERVPGTAFVELMLDDMEHDKYACWHLVGKDDKETSRRLTALLDRAEHDLSPWGRLIFWGSLREAKCFHEVCMARAIERLEKIEEAEKARAKAKEDKEDRARQDKALAAALREYLAAAMAHRQPKPADSRTAAEYRQWFKAHPEPKETEETDEEDSSGAGR
jgi:hypothetical protein